MYNFPNAVVCSTYRLNYSFVRNGYHNFMFLISMRGRQRFNLIVKLFRIFNDLALRDNLVFMEYISSREIGSDICSELQSM